ncbi:tetratricopeptide repeat protein [Rhodospirillales bacterium]|nr:tetratricopeptide repeat protein [Rhodospirillales bacterium]
MKLLAIFTVLITFLMFDVTHVLSMGNEDDTTSNSAKKHFANGKSAVYSGRFEIAIRLLKKVVAQEPKNADAHNYIGFSYRKTGKLDLAASSYKQVFAINPDHKGALEYQGELFLKLGNLSGANENLAKLERLCPSSCKELAELKRAIADFTATHGDGKGT